MEISELLRRGDFARSKLFLSQSQISHYSLEHDRQSTDHPLSNSTAMVAAKSMNNKLNSIRQTANVSRQGQGTNITRISDTPNSSQFNKEQQQQPFYFSNSSTRSKAKQLISLQTQQQQQQSQYTSQSQSQQCYQSVMLEDWDGGINPQTTKNMQPYSRMQFSSSVAHSKKQSASQTEYFFPSTTVAASKNVLSSSSKLRRTPNHSTTTNSTAAPMIDRRCQRKQNCLGLQQEQKSQNNVSQSQLLPPPHSPQLLQIHPTSSSQRQINIPRQTDIKSTDQTRIKEILSKTATHFRSKERRNQQETTYQQSQQPLLNVSNPGNSVNPSQLNNSRSASSQKNKQNIMQTTHKKLISDLFKGLSQNEKPREQSPFLKTASFVQNLNSSKETQANPASIGLSQQEKLPQARKRSIEKPKTKYDLNQSSSQSAFPPQFHSESPEKSHSPSTKNIKHYQKQKPKDINTGSVLEPVQQHPVDHGGIHPNDHEHNGQQIKGLNNLSTLVGVLRMKKKVADLIKKKSGVLLGQESTKASNSNSDIVGFPNHRLVLENLKKEEGYEIHDIYGTFHDKLKQIQVQISEALRHYALAYNVIEQVRLDKKQSLVINAVENTICSICITLEHLQQIPSHLDEREELDKLLAQMAISQMKSTQANLVIQIETVMIYAKYCQEISNFGKALRLYKQCKNMAITTLTQRYRMKSYRSIGQCFSHLKIYTTALVYFGKYLEYAWLMDDKEAELNSYDLLGVTYYLLGDLESAKQYHEKMIQNDNEPKDSDIRQLTIKKIIEKLKKINSEEYSQKLANSYKKFFAKVHSIDYEDDYECSSSEDEFQLSIPKTSSQKKNREYEEFIKEQSPDQLRKAETEKKRFIAIFNAEDRIVQQEIKKQANQNIRLQEYRRIAFQLPPAIKYNSAHSFKPFVSTQKIPFRINQFSINRNLENYLQSDQRLIKNSTFDFFKLVEDSNDKKLKHRIIFILSKFQNNLIFALSQIHSMREREKYSTVTRRRFAFSGLTDISNSANHLTLMNILIAQTQEQELIEENKRLKLPEAAEIFKPNSNQAMFNAIQRYQLPNEIKVTIKK